MSCWNGFDIVIKINYWFLDKGEGDWFRRMVYTASRKLLYGIDLSIK